jgi:hypothetical protein
MIFSFWFWTGTLNLIYLTWQDYKFNCTVDDRVNWIMLGLTFSLVPVLKIGISHTLLIIGLNMILQTLFRVTKALGEADINTANWMFLGFGWLSIELMVVGLALFVGLTSVFFFLKHHLLKYEGHVQFYGVILLSFLLVGLLFRFY